MAARDHSVIGNSDPLTSVRGEQGVPHLKIRGFVRKKVRVYPGALLGRKVAAVGADHVTSSTDHLSIRGVVNPHSIGWGLTFTSRADLQYGGARPEPSVCSPTSSTSSP